MAVTTVNGQRQAAKASFFYRPEVRQVIYQIILIAAVVFFVWEIASNVAENLRRNNIASGFGFWNRTAGFDISQTLIEYSNTSTYGRAFWVGLCNTLLVAGLGIVFATIVGFVIGIARLSSNWLVARLATVYVEVIRNLPLLLQLMFWYFAVLKNLPGPRQSLALPAGASLNVRGLYLPAPIPEAGFAAVVWMLVVGIAGLDRHLNVWARRRQMATGQRFPVLWTTLGLIFGLPAARLPRARHAAGLRISRAQGLQLPGRHGRSSPSSAALLVGLLIYTASFIAEIVRAGILGVSKGQKEAARALGLTNGQMLRLVVIPQASRIIIPPLTSQFLNLTKNSSLAVAIGYPDFVSVFTGTVLNQTGQAVEMILLTMLVFLTISLLTSAFMNWFNTRMALVER